MFLFRVEVQGLYVETWDVEAHDMQDAIRRVEWAEGSWLDGRWAGEPRYVAKPAALMDKDLAPAAGLDLPTERGRPS